MDDFENSLTINEFKEQSCFVFAKIESLSCETKFINLVLPNYWLISPKIVWLLNDFLKLLYRAIDNTLF
jgi:hypothetical protein